MNNLINCFLLHWELRIYTTHTSSGLLDVSNGGASSQQGQMIILQNTKRDWRCFKMTRMMSRKKKMKMQKDLLLKSKFKVSSFPLLPFFPFLEIWILKNGKSVFFYTPCSLRVTAVNTRYLVSANRRSCQGTASGESVVIRKENSAEWRFLTTCCPVSIVALIRATLRNAQQCSCCFLPVRMRYVLP